MTTSLPIWIAAAVGSLCKKTRCEVSVIFLIYFLNKKGLHGYSIWKDWKTGLAWHRFPKGSKNMMLAIAIGVKGLPLRESCFFRLAFHDFPGNMVSYQYNSLQDRKFLQDCDLSGLLQLCLWSILKISINIIYTYEHILTCIYCSYRSSSKGHLEWERN